MTLFQCWTNWDRQSQVIDMFFKKPKPVTDEHEQHYNEFNETTIDLKKQLKERMDKFNKLLDEKKKNVSTA